MTNRPERTNGFTLRGGAILPGIASVEAGKIELDAAGTQVESCRLLPGVRMDGRRFLAGKPVFKDDTLIGIGRLGDWPGVLVKIDADLLCFTDQAVLCSRQGEVINLWSGADGVEDKQGLKAIPLIRVSDRCQDFEQSLWALEPGHQLLVVDKRHRFRRLCCGNRHRLIYLPCQLEELAEIIFRKGVSQGTRQAYDWALHILLILRENGVSCGLRIDELRQLRNRS